MKKFPRLVLCIRCLRLTEDRVFVCSYCEAAVGEFVNPGDFNLITHGHKHHHQEGLGSLLHRNSSSSSSSSSSSDEGVKVRDGSGIHNADGTVSPGGQKKKLGLLQRIIHH